MSKTSSNPNSAKETSKLLVNLDKESSPRQDQWASLIHKHVDLTPWWKAVKIEEGVILRG